MYPYPSPSLLSKGISMIKNIQWGAFLDGTQKTLGVINQAIPIVYQVKPIINNAKTLFRIANVLNDNTSNQSVSIDEATTNQQNSPIFYI